MCADFTSKVGIPFCKKSSRGPLSLTAEQLFNLILHLATFSKWSIENDGTLQSSSGYYDKFKNIFSSDAGRTISVFGFTNKDADPTQRKTYETLDPLATDLESFYNEWRKGLLKGAITDMPIDYLEIFQKDFLKNTLAASRINRWTIRGIQRVLPEKWQPTRSDPGYRYLITFVAPGGYNFKLLFHPSDRLYVCNYETEDEIKNKQSGLVLSKFSPSIYMEIDEGKGLGEIECPLASDGSKRSANKVKVSDLIDFIRHEGVIMGKWKATGDNILKAKSIADGIPINAVYGYRLGIPILWPYDGDNKGLVLIEAERYGRDTWRLRFSQTNRATFYSTPTIDAYVDGDTLVQYCFK